MLTILAWMVFLPAAFWNVVFWSVAFSVLIESKTGEWKNLRNLRDAVLSAALLLIPGVYLFGWV